MWAGDAAGATAQRDGLAFPDLIALLNVELGEMHIHGHESQAVIDDNAIAFVEKLARQYHFARVRRMHWGSGGRAKIISTMHASQLAIKGAACAEGLGDLRRHRCDEVA